jgi:hypothetical protein
LFFVGPHEAYTGDGGEIQLKRKVRKLRICKENTMIAGARYGHTNLIANDWRSLSRFYQEQFGCTPVPPERDFKGRDLERGMGIPGAELDTRKNSLIQSLLGARGAVATSI